MASTSPSGISGSSTSSSKEETVPCVTTTDILIVGTGPAGASLACFLASYGEATFHLSSICRVADREF